MENENLDYPTFTECMRKVRAIDDTLHILSGKWTLVLIAHLCYKPMRYSELLKDLNGIAGKVLSRELKDLEINGLIVREVSEGQPLTVTYKISQYGQTLKELTDGLADWGLLHRERIFNADKFEKPMSVSR